MERGVGVLGELLWWGAEDGRCEAWEWLVMCFLANSDCVGCIEFSQMHILTGVSGQ